MIKAQATVDNVEIGGKPSHVWRVHVSDPSHDKKGEYVITADDEGLAAMEGLRRFVKEHGQPNGPTVGG